MKSFGTAMSELGSGAFFESLGQYVYGYRKKKSNIWDYIGKGNGNRGIQHVKTKGYDVDNLYIIARNLERFENKQDWQSFLLESYLIAFEQPKDNSVSGHYEECFIMAKFSELYGTFVDSQFDAFAEFPEWYRDNYDTKIRGRVNAFTIKKDGVELWSQTVDSIQLQFYADNNGNPTVCKMYNWQKKNREETSQKILGFLTSCGIDEDDIESVGSRESYQFKVSSMDQLLQILADLTS